ncbi:MAG: hypothetical protein HFG71_10570 [Hungatella sp.]|jgi:hypothetical protein|nr:hypothetical protein [Hungatella sp.]
MAMVLASCSDGNGITWLYITQAYTLSYKMPGYIFGKKGGGKMKECLLHLPLWQIGRLADWQIFRHMHMNLIYVRLIHLYLVAQSAAAP